MPGADNMTLRGNSAAVARMLATDTAGKITGFGATLLKFPAVTEEGLALAESASAASQEFIELLLSNGVKIEFKKVTKVLNPDGSEKTGGSGSDSTDEISFTTAETAMSNTQDLANARGVAYLLSIPLGDVVDDDGEGFALLIGKLTGKIERKTKAEEVVLIPTVWKGQSMEATDAGKTALETTGLTTVTPLGGEEITFPATLTTAEVTKLLKGEIVFK